MDIKKINHHQLASNWLLTMIILVFLIIMVGGLTRLTDSGLSITEWELFIGIFPPITNEDWISYFNLYKMIPQYNLVNPLMTMDEFKIIFYWEYFHRLLARLIGLTYLIPLIYFSYRNTFDKKTLVILCRVERAIFSKFRGPYHPSLCPCLHQDILAHTPCLNPE